MQDIQKQGTIILVVVWEGDSNSRGCAYHGPSVSPSQVRKSLSNAIVRWQAAAVRCRLPLPVNDCWLLCYILDRMNMSPQTLSVMHLHATAVSDV
jgi:hypothetical protein